MKKKKEKEKRAPNIKNGLVIVDLTVLALMLLLVLMALIFVVHAPWYVIVSEMVTQAIVIMGVLLLEDPFRKKLDLKKAGKSTKLSMTYKIGLSIFICSLFFLYAGSRVKTTLWLFVDWAVAAVIGAVGFVWYYKVYGHEKEIAQKTEQKLWMKRKKMYEEQGLTEEEIFADAREFLEYHLCGDNLEGDLDFARPLGLEGLTLAELEAEYPADTATIEASAYIKSAIHACFMKKEGK